MIGTSRSAKPSRRHFLALAAAAASAATTPLIVDTHLEVWTFDPK
ncbi:MAG: twin-arginine translocation signal domain-containing protein, partial [Acidobacteriaceae bacterium]|nr:twin-arginine translocation signal domain-containing protein [Acidobacteriaceae bacterium]